MPETEKARQEITDVFYMLASAANVAVGEHDVPEIELTDDSKKQPKYKFEKQTILMPYAHIHSGISYAEECSHALRDLSMRRAGVPYESQDRYVHEFFGRAGETICRHAANGTELGYLFSSPPRDVSNPEARKKAADALRKARRYTRELASAHEKCIAGRQYLKGITEESRTKAEALVSRAERGEIGFDEFTAGIKALRTEYNDALKIANDGSMMFPQLDMLNTGMHVTDLRYLDCSIFQDATDEEKKETLRYHFEEFRNSPAKIRFDLDDFMLLESAIDLKLVIESQREHGGPYLFAQQYTAEELLAVPLYAMPDSEVKKRFFKRRKNVCQKR